MIALRSFAFNVGFYLWTLVIGLYGAPLLLGSKRTVMAFGRLWAAGSLGLLAWTVGLRHEIRGIENLPEGAAIIALKHQSAWDTIILPVMFRHPAIVIKHELAWLPIYGWYAVRAGGIPVDRRRRQRPQAHAGTCPQGGGERAADRHLPGRHAHRGRRAPALHPGVAALYTQLDLPLVPVAVNSGGSGAAAASSNIPAASTLRSCPRSRPGSRAARSWPSSGAHRGSHRAPRRRGPRRIAGLWIIRRRLPCEKRGRNPIYHWLQCLAPQRSGDRPC